MQTRDKKIGIIGMGNVGQALAGYLSSMHYCVYLYNRSEKRIQEIRQKSNKITLCGIFEKEEQIYCITSDIKKVVKECDILFITIPADSHGEIAEKIAGSLRNNQLIVLVPGRTLGAYKFHKSLCESGLKENVTIAETSTVFWACRLISNGLVQIYSKKKYVEMAALNNTASSEMIKEVQVMFPEIKMVESTFITGLNNIGMVFHPAPFLLNLSRIDRGEKFFYYKEGISPAVASFIEKIDCERLMVGKRLGIQIESAQEWLKNTYGAEGDTLFECIQNTDAYGEVLAPQTIHSRYIFEDISTGLVTLYQMGRCFNMNLSYSDSVIKLANLIFHVDFYQWKQCVNEKDIEKILKRI